MSEHSLKNWFLNKNKLDIRCLQIKFLFKINFYIVH